MQHEQITGYHNLWFWVNEQTDKLDLNTSLIMPKHNFALTTGEAVYTNSYYETFDKFNELFDMNIDSKLSSVAGNTHFTIAFSEKEKEVVVPEIVQSEPTIEPVSETTSVVEEEVEVNTSELIALEVAETKSTTVDWDYVHSLKNTKSGKKDLDEYAETFGAKLNRVKKIDNMVADFKEFMGVE